jgi:iron complex transport system substrate-binding protein
MRMVWPLLLLAGCAQGPSIAPGKIVSNNPCIDAVLAEIADPTTIGAVSLYSHDPESASAPVEWARRFPGIGASAEELIAARPSLVLSGNYASAGTDAALARAGIRVESFGVPATLAESQAQIVAIARAIGREAQGKALAARMSAAVQPHMDGRSAIIWTSGGFVPGKGTIRDEMLALAGFRNASAKYGLGEWDLLPLETLLRDPPDIIFTPVRADGGEARALALRLHTLGHLRGRTRIVAFPERLLNCGGPGVIEAMQYLRSAGRS